MRKLYSKIIYFLFIDIICCFCLQNHFRNRALQLNRQAVAIYLAKTAPNFWNAGQEVQTSRY